jgi:hypothetical protein
MSACVAVMSKRAKKKSRANHRRHNEQKCPLLVLLKDFRLRAMPSKNERVELEMKIMKARQLARGADDTTLERLNALVVELEQKLREIDE